MLVGSPIRQKRQLNSEYSPTISPSNRSKKIKYEEDMIANLGYYCDPSTPNLYILSSPRGSGTAGLFDNRKDYQPFKRHQSKVRAILPPRSQSLFTTPPSLMIPSPYISGHSVPKSYFHSNECHLSPSSSSLTDPQETDEEILSTLASIASFDDEIDNLEAVFLHFNDE